MNTILEFVVGGLTLGLPGWFAYLDRRVFPRLRWVREDGSTPTWGHFVVAVGVGLAVLIALAAPLTGFQPHQ